MLFFRDEKGFLRVSTNSRSGLIAKFPCCLSQKCDVVIDYNDIIQYNISMGLIMVIIIYVCRILVIANILKL